MRFHSSGLEAWSSSGRGFFQNVGRGSWMERSLPIGRNHSHSLRGRNSAHSPSIPLLSKPAPLTSLSPCLLASTIWSIFCLHASCSLKSPPWPPNSCLLSAPADNPSHHAKTHVAHKQRPTPNPPIHKIHLHISIISAGIDCSAVSRKGETEIRGEGGKITGEWKACIARRNTLRQLLVFGIAALMVLHAREVPSIY